MSEVMLPTPQEAHGRILDAAVELCATPEDQRDPEAREWLADGEPEAAIELATRRASARDKIVLLKEELDVARDKSSPYYRPYWAYVSVATPVLPAFRESIDNPRFLAGWLCNHPRTWQDPRYDFMGTLLHGVCDEEIEDLLDDEEADD